MKKTLLITLSLGTVCALGALFARPFFAPAETPPAPRASRTVKLHRVESGNTAATIVYPGRITAREHANLFFRVSGPVIDNALTLGMEIRRGDVLMRIDPRDYEREVARISHELEVMQAKHLYLQKEYERMAQLHRSNAVSRAAFESAFSARDASAAEIRGKETALQIARDRLADTRLIAPFNGRVTRLNIEQFEMAKANEVVVSLQNLENLDVIVNIPEGNIPHLASLGKGALIGKKFPVYFPDRDRQEEATLAEFSPAASAETGTYELRLAMKQSQSMMILPGMTAEVRNLPGKSTAAGSACRIPFSAVFKRNGKSMVWVFQPATSTAEAREIQPGALSGQSIETDSLEPGVLIVAAGGAWIDGRTPLTVLNPEVLHEHR